MGAAVTSLADRGAALASLKGAPLALAPGRIEALLAGAYAGRAAAPAQTDGAVAVLPLFGFLDAHETFAMRYFGGTPLDRWSSAFRFALAAPHVRSIVVQIDSPGGSVYGAEEAARLVYSARGKKRVVAVADSLAASAAYWIGSAAEEFVITPSGEAPSMGIYVLHFDESEALGKEGVKVSVIRSGPNKGEGLRYAPLSEAARMHMQSMVDAYATQFTRSVARGRGVSESVVRDRFGEGRTFDAERAVALGIADRVATLEQVVEELRDGRSPAREPTQAQQADSWARAYATADDATRHEVWKTCIHEASHTVVAVLQGAALHSVQLEWTTEGGLITSIGGFCQYRRADEMTDVALAAGLAGEQEFFPSDLPTFKDHDWKRIAEIQQRAGLAVNEGRAVKVARGILQENRSAVHTCAAALERTGYLSAEEATAAVCEGLPDWRRNMLGFGPAAS